MSHKSRVVTSTACPVDVSRPVVTVSCPKTFPTAGVTDKVDKKDFFDKKGFFPFPFSFGGKSVPGQVFKNPAVDLAPFSKLASLAAFSPAAALAAKSPVLGIFNPAINPAAAFLQFNPGAAPTLALTGKGKPFGKFGI